MSYSKTTNFGAKDSLPSGDTNKIVKGAEFDVEFNNIQTAISTLTSTVSGLSGETSVSDITYAAGSASVGANQDYYVTAPNPGAAIGFIQPGGVTGVGQFKTAVNGGQINLRNTANSSAYTATWVTIGHST